MKVVIYTRSEPTAHPEAGILKPGKNEIADDKLADRLIAAGRYTGDFIARDTADSGPSEEAGAGKPYYAAGGEVHHLFADCSDGNNVEPKNRRRGTGGKPLCRECARRIGAKTEERE